MSMGGGGGGGGTNQNDLRIAEMQQREREAAQRAQQEREWNNLVTQVNLFSQNLQNSLASARQRYTDRLTGRGYDQNEINTLVNRALDTAYRSVPANTAELGLFDPQTDKYFSDDVLENAILGMQNDRRTRYTNRVQELFPTGVESTLFTYDMDDPYVDAILGSQRTDAQAMLERARARGNLDETGLARGLARLDELGTAGRSEAQRISDAIIDANRAAMRGIANRALTDASNYQVGQDWTAIPYRQEWSQTQQRLAGDLEGAVRSALEGQQFFDISDLITQAGIRQGAQNPTIPQADAVAARQQIRDTRRGIGGGGVF